MDFLTIVSLGISLYCLFMISKMKEKNLKDVKMEQARRNLLYERILNLKGKQSELIIEKPLFFINVLHSIGGEIIDVDKEWVLIMTSKEKKEIQRLMRISNIADVKEIVEPRN